MKSRSPRPNNGCYRVIKKDQPIGVTNDIEKMQRNFDALYQTDFSYHPRQFLLNSCPIFLPRASWRLTFDINRERALIQLRHYLFYHQSFPLIYYSINHCLNVESCRFLAGPDETR